MNVFETISTYADNYPCRILLLRSGDYNLKQSAEEIIGMSHTSVKISGGGSLLILRYENGGAVFASHYTGGNLETRLAGMEFSQVHLMNPDHGQVDKIPFLLSRIRRHQNLSDVKFSITYE